MKKIVLTNEEKMLIQELRQKKEDDLPKMVGFAKEDLYQVNNFDPPNWFVSASEKKGMLEDFNTNYIELSVSAGNQFDCFIENECEAWYDTESGLFAGMDAGWARKYLKNIKLVKKH